MCPTFPAVWGSCPTLIPGGISWWVSNFHDDAITDVITMPDDKGGSGTHKPASFDICPKGRRDLLVMATRREPISSLLYDIGPDPHRLARLVAKTKGAWIVSRTACPEYRPVRPKVRSLPWHASSANHPPGEITSSTRFKDGAEVSVRLSAIRDGTKGRCPGARLSRDRRRHGLEGADLGSKSIYGSSTPSDCKARGYESSHQQGNTA